MSSEHMLLPRGGYDFVQVSPTEYRWADAELKRSAVVMAPEGKRFGWYYHVHSGSPERNYIGRKPSIDAAFRQAVLSLDLLASTPGHHMRDDDPMDAPAPRPHRRMAAVNRLLEAEPVMKMVRLLASMKTENG